MQAEDRLAAAVAEPAAVGGPADPCPSCRVPAVPAPLVPVPAALRVEFSS